nr:pilus assembly protein N-terminal domain-containing protein [Aliamphritea spongicola]
MAALLSCVVIAAQVQAAVQADKPELHSITVGQTLLLKTKGVSRVALGNGEIAQVKVLKDTQEVLLIAKQQGVTDLRIWSRNNPPKIYVVQVHGAVQGPEQGELERLVENMPGITLEKVNNSFILRGEAKKQQDLAQAEKIAESYDNVLSLVSAPLFEHQKTVLIHARFIEVNRNALQKIGINWSDLINGPTFSFLGDYQANGVFRGTGLPAGAALAPGATGLPLNVGSGNSYFGLSTSLTSVIDILDNNGDARLLAEPTLSSISGGQAKFLAGGEFPIPVTSDNGVTNVSFREYGINLEVSPLVDDSGYIQTRVDVGVSSIDQSVTVLGVPGLLKRTAATEMNVYDGETMVIAGLFSQEDAKIVDKVPGLGDLPILGELFKSREFRNKETELVVLVTPTIIRGDDDTVTASESKFNRLSTESEAFRKFDLMD